MRVDIGCGNKKKEGFTGLDNRSLDGVDIVHDLETFPYPLDSVSDVNASHILEHIDPKVFIQLMDEIWRIMGEGEFIIEVPHGLTESYIQDPTHVNPISQRTFEYFCPNFPLYNIYKPKPWNIEKNEMDGDFIKVILTKYGIQRRPK